MELYTINGIEFEYDTWDLTNMELLGSETERIAEIARSLAEGKGYSDSVANLREFCESIFDMFDELVGEGTARKIFGTRTNVVEIKEAYDQFILDVSNVMASTFKDDGEHAPTNREQRRAQERARRREEARVRAMAKQHADESV